MNSILKKAMASIMAIAITASMLCSCSSDDSSSKAQSQADSDSSGASDVATDVTGGKVVIAEVMPRNKDTIDDEDGESGDYILLYNGGSAVSLSGYYLSDDKDTPKMWQFPDVTIEQESYLLVFADSTNKQGGEYLHTNFSIGADGEKIFLTYPDSTTQELYVPAMPQDVAYGLVFDGDEAGSYHYFKSGSPKGKNTSEHSENLSDIVEAEVANVVLNEFMTQNKTFTDNYGESSDWIELYNASDKEIDLSGYTITDSYSNPNKWTVPQNVKIGAGEYLIIWFDGLDEYKDGNIHGSFKLSDDDDGIMMTDTQGFTVFKVDMMPAQENASYGLKDDGEYAYFTLPTPNEKNQ